jgi:hypothetical protein
MLWLQVEHRLVGLHVDGYREMLMGDQPVAADLAKADGRAHPDIGVFSACSRSSDSIETAAEGHVIACRNVQVANLVTNNRVSEGGEPIRPVLSIRDGAVIPQRGWDVEHHDVLRVIGHEPIDVLGA